MFWINPIERVIIRASKNPRFGGYRNYDNVIKKMIKDDVWTNLSSDYALSHLEELAQIYDIKLGTLKEWHYKLKKNPQWFPEHSKVSYVFSPEEEGKIVEIIQFIIDQQQYPITNEFIRQIMLAYYYSIKEPDMKRPFSASNKYIRRFKNKHGFSRRRLHYKRRPTATDEEIQSFLNIIGRIFKIAKHDHIVNVDETMWRCVQSNLTTWSKKGSDGVVIYTGTNDKDCFTALASVTAEGEKLPLILIAEGASEKSESSWFGENRNIEKKSDDEEEEEHEIEMISNPGFKITKSRFNDEEYIKPESYTDHSIKGWTTRSTWKRYLYALRYKFIKPLKNTHFYDVKNRIFLIADSYSVHNCEECIEYARALNIQIIQIPSGTTDLFQPLDKKVFGVLKAKARSFINQILCKDIMQLYDSDTGEFKDEIPPPRIITKKDATAILEKCWESLKKETILSAWHDALLKHFESSDYDGKEDSEELSDETFRMKIVDSYFMKNNHINQCLIKLIEGENKIQEYFTSNRETWQASNKEKLSQLFLIRGQLMTLFQKMKSFQEIYDKIEPKNDSFDVLMKCQLPVINNDIFDIMIEVQTNQELYEKIIYTINLETSRKLSYKIKEINRLISNLKEKIEQAESIVKQVEPANQEITPLSSDLQAPDLLSNSDTNEHEVLQTHNFHQRALQQRSETVPFSPQVFQHPNMIQNPIATDFDILSPPRFYQRASQQRHFQLINMNANPNLSENPSPLQHTQFFAPIRSNYPQQPSVYSYGSLLHTTPPVRQTQFFTPNGSNYPQQPSLYTYYAPDTFGNTP